MTYRPSDLRVFLDTLSVKPKKSLSQNFLIDGNIIRKIARFADVKGGDRVVEIGPGPGALTEILLESGAHVTAIEKDAVFAKALSRLQTKDGRLTVIENDVLEVSVENCFHQKAKIVANLPYHLTTPILSKLLPFNDAFESITVMIQKEVADRFIAHPSTKEYGSFSVFLQFYSDPEYGFTVEPTCFYPRPKVKSSVVKLKLHQPPEVHSIERFFKMTRTAFQKRRKMLRVSLKNLYGNEAIESALSSLNINPQSRPEDLSLNDFLRLFQVIDQTS